MGFLQLLKINSRISTWGYVTIHSYPHFFPTKSHPRTPHYAQCVMEGICNNLEFSGYQLYIQNLSLFLLKIDYTECHRRNGPNFGREFLMLNYRDITQNTYVQSWTVSEIMASEVWNFTAVTHLLIAKFILKLAGICGFCNVNICT